MDGKIPHATHDAVLTIIEEGKRRAKAIDGKDKALTLRLRDLGGLIRAAGDLAVMECSKYIEKKHVERAIELSMPVEDKIEKKYGSLESGMMRDVTKSQKSPYNYWNQSGPNGYQ